MKGDTKKEIVIETGRCRQEAERERRAVKKGERRGGGVCMRVRSREGERERERERERECERERERVTHLQKLLLIFSPLILTLFPILINSLRFCFLP